jgi:hypothetical protein
VREIAREIGRSPSTISRELRRNAATRGGKLEYRPSVAQWHAEQRAKRPKAAKLAVNHRLRDYVAERLAGEIRRLDGRSGRWSAGRVEGTAPRPSQGPPLGPGVEPGADRGPAGGRLPG